MHNLKPEKLKVIAEGVYPDYIRASEKDRFSDSVSSIWIYTHSKITGHVVMITRNGESIEYNPLTNAEQCMEIMEKLIRIGWVLKDIGNITQMHYQGTGFPTRVIGKTIAEAVCNAAYEYFRERC